MREINIILSDPTGYKEQNIMVSDDIKCGILITEFVEKNKLPLVGPNGKAISYDLIHKGTGCRLLESQTLGEAGVQDGDVFEITAATFCPKCGSNTGSGLFCSLCGTSLYDSGSSKVRVRFYDDQPYNQSEFAQSQPNQTNNGYGSYKKKNSNLANRIFSIAGVVGGLISVILSFMVFDMSTGRGVYGTSYGGDIYTRIHDATAQTADNVRYVAEILSMGIASLLFVFGTAMICYFGIKIFKNFEK